MTSLIYARFQAKGKYLKHPDKLREMTTRYMEVYPTRELRARHVNLDLYKFLPLEVLTPSSTDMQRYKCEYCERMLVPASFPQHAADHRDSDQTLEPFTRCRLCTLLCPSGPKPQTDTCPAALGMVKTTSMPYMLVSTYEQAKAAANALAGYSTLILDCEGQDFGSSHGVLSIVSIGGYPVSDTVYLFDVLALREKHNPLLGPLLSILRNPYINKLVWDGRSDFLELALSYDITVEGVLDMQLAEVMQRSTDLNSHSLAYFRKSKPMMADIRRNPRLLEGIHRLLGLDHCADILHIVDALGGKDRK